MNIFYRNSIFEKFGKWPPSTLERRVFYLAFLALIKYEDNEYSYILAPQQLSKGDKVIAGKNKGKTGKITKVNENNELLVQISEEVEVKLAQGMISDLYLTAESIKKTDTSIKKDSNENKSLLSGIFGKKKN